MINRLDKVRPAVQLHLVPGRKLDLNPAHIIAGIPMTLRQDRAMKAWETER